ncbi:unnamed protein product, partial [Closterium sp. NIES-65]
MYIRCQSSSCSHVQCTSHELGASRTRTAHTPPSMDGTDHAPWLIVHRISRSPILAASRLQPSHAAVAKATSVDAQVLVGTQMTISGLSFSRRSSSSEVCGYDRVNPCWGGTCIHRGTFDYTCVCLPGRRARRDFCGHTLNKEDISSITVLGSDWRCKDVYSMYGLTLQQFTHMNPGIDCSALLPEYQELVVRELLPACSAFYYIQPGDTCSSVAQFLNITEKSLEQFNPDVTCPSHLPAFRSLCVERDPAKARPTCAKEIEIGRVVDFKHIEASYGATLVDICRLNPWISFRHPRHDNYG